MARQIELAGHPVKYETEKIRYTKPAKSAVYTPDFLLTTKRGKRIFVEVKGRFLLADRQKHRIIQEMHPDLDIRFVFMNPNSKINKGSKTSYADWCEKNGFKWAKGHIPPEWFDE